MSASVFNPHVLAELRHIRSNVTSDRVTNNCTPNFVAISSVRRNIFGPIDHEECRNFVERQLKQQQAQDIEYWGFDFVNEVPRPGNSRFVWEPMIEKPTSRPQKRPPCEPEYDISHLYPESLEDVRPAIEEVKTASKTTAPDAASIRADKTKQSLITDFLKSKKVGSHRLQRLKKNMAVTPSPNRPGRVTRARRTIRS